MLFLWCVIDKVIVLRIVYSYIDQLMIYFYLSNYDLF